MNTIVAVLLAAIVALLLAIVVELMKIRLALVKLPNFRQAQNEVKEGRQTVTVNVGALGPTEVVPVTVIENTETDPPVEAPPVEEPPVKPAARPPAAPKSNQRELRTLKCPHCGAENTSFRTECFQCGKSL